MRITTLLRRLIGVMPLYVKDVSFTDGDLVVDVCPANRQARCGHCGQKASCYDRAGERLWRHLSWGRVRVLLRYNPWRTNCKRCGVKVERVPWAAQGSRFTYDAEEFIAYLAQITDKTTVQRLMRIAWRTVGVVVERVIERRLSPERLEGLKNIGIDEFSYRKHHKYLTTVVDHDRRQVVWVGHGKSGKTLHDFFDLLGAKDCAGIETVTMDMAQSYISAVENRLPKAQIVFDRFHVQKLATDALDEVRRSMVREAVDPDEEKIIKKTRWALLKNPWNLNSYQRLKLREVEKHNKKLFRGYLLKELLAQALDYRQPKRAKETLEDWLAWASRSRLKPFVKAARTIRKRKDDILAYIKLRLTNGLVEGLNNKIRVITRRAYGFHSPGPLISMIFLCCGGITLDPPLP